MNELESPRGKDTDSGQLRFPLEVGKQWNYTDQWVNYNTPLGTSSGPSKGSITVIGYEKVRVRAGEFDAFKLAMKASWGPDVFGYSGTADRTYWYAPAARVIVKYHSADAMELGGVFQERACELVEFQLQP